jgi:hypothetical protein
MKTDVEKEKFIELRARGLSFSKIAEEIGVSKPILIKWNSELSKEIANQKFLASEELLERYKLMKAARLEVFASTLSGALQELQIRALDTLSPKELLNLISYLESRLTEEATTVSYTTDETVTSWSLAGDQPVKIPLFD